MVKKRVHLFLGRPIELNLADNNLFVRVVCRAELDRPEWVEADKVLQGTSVHKYLCRIGFAYHDGHADTRLFVAWY